MCLKLAHLVCIAFKRCNLLVVERPLAQRVSLFCLVVSNCVHSSFDLCAGGGG